MPNDLEKDVLAQSIRDVDFARKATARINESLLSTRPRIWIWRRLRKTIADHGCLPTATQWRAMIDSDWSKPAQRKVVTTALRILWKHGASPAAATSLDIVEKLHREADIRRTTEQVAKSIMSGDLKGADSALQEAARRSLAASRKTSAARASVGMVDRFAQYRTGRRYDHYFESPLPAMNRVCGGNGVPNGKLIGLAAWTNMGKSAFSCDVAYTAALHPNARVLWVTTEETADEKMDRLVGRYSGFDRSEIVNGVLAASDYDKIESEFNAGGAKEVIDRIHILDVGADAGEGATKTSAALGELFDLRRENPGAPILVVVDSPDHLMPGVDADNKRLQQAGVWFDMLMWTKLESLQPLSVWAFTQVPNRGNYTKNWELGMISETVYKVQTADFFMGLVEGGEDEFEPEDDFETPIDAVIRKNRFGRIKRMRIHTMANHGTCRFREVSATENDGEDDDE